MFVFVLFPTNYLCSDELCLFRYLDVFWVTDMSTSCSAYGCRSVLPRCTQISKCYYHITGLVKRNIHNCLFICKFTSCCLCRDGLPVTARAGTWRCGMYRAACQKMLGCGDVWMVTGCQMAGAVLMSPCIIQFELLDETHIFLLAALTNFS